MSFHMAHLVSIGRRYEKSHALISLDNILETEPFEQSKYFINKPTDTIEYNN